MKYDAQFSIALEDRVRIELIVNRLLTVNFPSKCWKRKFASQFLKSFICVPCLDGSEKVTPLMQSLHELLKATSARNYSPTTSDEQGSFPLAEKKESRHDAAIDDDETTDIEDLGDSADEGKDGDTNLFCAF